MLRAYEYTWVKPNTQVVAPLMHSHTLVITALFIKAPCKCSEQVLLEERAEALQGDVGRDGV